MRITAIQKALGEAREEKCVAYHEALASYVQGKAAGRAERDAEVERLRRVLERVKGPAWERAEAAEQEVERLKAGVVEDYGQAAKTVAETILNLEEMRDREDFGDVSGKAAAITAVLTSAFVGSRAFAERRAEAAEALALQRLVEIGGMELIMLNDMVFYSDLDRAHAAGKAEGWEACRREVLSMADRYSGLREAVGRIEALLPAEPSAEPTK